ncbi:MAG: RNA polymerase sigma factor [Patescibacteria group bacterium]|nr:RNA polymerase sigma factor [Patescibacteria group bacterium]
MELTQENRLVAGAKQGDTSAFGELYDAYFEKLYSFIYYRTHHRQTAEDVVGQAFLRAWEKIGSYNPQKARFSTWLFQIARNLLVDHYRKTAPTQNIESAWDIGSDAGLEADAETALLIGKIKPHLDKLSPQQKQVLIMRIWEDLPYSEIAQILGTSEAACKMAFSRGVAELKERIILVLLILQIIKLHY